MLFCASAIAIVVIAIIGFAKGHPERLFVPYDSDSKGCGTDDIGTNGISYSDYKYIYFMTPMYIPGENLLNRTICVKQCPIFEFASQIPSGYALDCHPNQLTSDCK